MTTKKLDVLEGRRRGRPVRLICFGISAEEHDRLNVIAAAEERDAEQHARWLVREAIRAAQREEAAS